MPNLRDTIRAAYQLAAQKATQPTLRPEFMDKPEWWKDQKLDWDKVPLGKVHQFKEVPQKFKNYTDPNYDPKPMNDFLQKQIEDNKLKPGDGFTIQENDGPKTYQYLGPQDHPDYGPGRNFFLKPPASSPEIG